MDPIRYAWNCCNPHVPFPVVLARGAAATDMAAGLLLTPEGGSGPPRCGEGVLGEGPDWELVENGDIDQRVAVADAADDDVGAIARLRELGAGVPGEDERRHIGSDDDADDLPRMDGDCIDGAAEQDLGSDEPAAVAWEQYAERAGSSRGGTDCRMRKGCAESQG